MYDHFSGKANSTRKTGDHMSTDEREDNTIYKVVVNHEEQYSIWPADRENALGWNDAGKQGTKAECLAYIEEVWTDMRPLSLRKKMEESAQEQQSGGPQSAEQHEA
jgi:MbtH protein